MNPTVDLPPANNSDPAEARARGPRREYMRKWRAANPDRERERARQDIRKWRAANPGKEQEYKRRRNPDKVRELARKWREANPEKVSEYNRKARETFKAKADEEFRQRFEAERQRERARHLHMKAAQLRSSIMRSGEYPETVWLGDIMRDLVRYVADHVPTDDHDVDIYGGAR